MLSKLTVGNALYTAALAMLCTIVDQILFCYDGAHRLNHGL